MQRKKDKLFLGGLLKTAGSIAGQALIPIPGVGAAIGGALGGALGNAIDPQTGAPMATPVQPVTTTLASRGNQYAYGGKMTNPIPGVAQKVVGPSHEGGGVPLGGVEVEGGETIQDQMVFSKRVRVPGQSMTFADAHERLIKKGGNSDAVKRLFALQQKTTGGGNMDGKMEEGGFLDSVLPYAGDILNIGRGLFSSTEVAPPTRVNRSHLGSMPTTVDTSFEEAQARSSSRAITGNPNATANNKLAAHSNFLSNSHRIQSGKRNAENALLGQRAQEEGKLNYIDSQYQSQARSEQQQADAAKQNILNTGITGAATTYQQQKALEGARDSDTLSFMGELSQLPPNDRIEFMNTVRNYLPAHLRGITFSPQDMSGLSETDRAIVEQAIKIHLPKYQRVDTTANTPAGLVARNLMNYIPGA